MGGRDPERRALAEEAIDVLGAEALPHLVGQLSWLDSRWKLKLLEWLSERRWAFVDKRISRLEATLDAFSVLGPRAAPAVPRLAELLPKHWFAAASLLSKIGPGLRDHPDAIKAIPLLIPHIGQNEADGRAAATEALIGIGPAAAPALLAALTNRSEFMRQRAAAVLAKVGPREIATPAIVALLKDPEPDVRRAAVGLLPEIDEGKVIPAVLPLLADENPEVRRGAAAALPLFKSGRSSAIYELIRLLDDPEVRITAAAALAKIDRRQTVAIQVLIDALAEPYAYDAIGALGELGGLAQDAVPPLRRELNQALDESFAAGASAPLRSNTEITRQEQEKIDRRRQQEAHLRFRLVQALGKIGPAATPAIPELTRALSDLDDSVRAAAAEALRGVGSIDASAVSHLVAALRDREAHVRRSAAHALSKLAPANPLVTQAIIQAAADSDASVRNAAVAALGEMHSPDPRAITALAEILRDSDRQVRISAANALGKLASAAKPAIPALRLALNDPSLKVREAAASALQEIER